MSDATNAPRGDEEIPTRTASPIPLIIDTDPGIDDATAIMLALSHPERLDVRLLTSVGGNVAIEKTTRNCHLILDFLHRGQERQGAAGVPVAMGMTAPDSAQTADYVHGESGLGDWRYDSDSVPSLEELGKLKEDAKAAKAAGGRVSTPALEAQKKVLKEARAKNERVTIVAIGPLTNIRALLEDLRDNDPDLVKYIEQIVIMGGSLGKGNKGPFTEFNFGTDPEAASAVLSREILPEELRSEPDKDAEKAGKSSEDKQDDKKKQEELWKEKRLAPRIVILPGDVAEHAVLSQAELDELGSINAVGAAIADLMSGGDPAVAGSQTKLLYDPTTIAYLCQPVLFSTERYRVAVSTNDKLTEGALAAFTEFNLKNTPKVHGNDLREATICTSVDKDGLFGWIKASVHRWDGASVG